MPLPLKCCTVLALLVLTVLPASAQLMIVGNDEKVTFDDKGTPTFSAPA